MTSSNFSTAKCDQTYTPSFAELRTQETCARHKRKRRSAFSSQHNPLPNWPAAKHRSDSSAKMRNEQVEPSNLYQVLSFRFINLSLSLHTILPSYLCCAELSSATISKATLLLLLFCFTVYSNTKAEE